MIYDESAMVAMREKLSDEALIARAQDTPRNYHLRWSQEILDMVDRWAMLNGVRPCSNSCCPAVRADGSVRCARRRTATTCTSGSPP